MNAKQSEALFSTFTKGFYPHSQCPYTDASPANTKRGVSLARRQASTKPLIPLRNSHLGRQVLLHEVQETALEQHGVLMGCILGRVGVAGGDRLYDLFMVPAELG